jgi:hypothetical protein
MLAALSVIVLATAPAPAPAANSIDSLFAHLPDIHATRLTAPVTIDGLLNEEVWKQATPITNFIQSDQNEGQQPSQKTEVRVAYDDKAIYIGARMWDSAPDSILARLVRRDVQVTADKFSLFLDPFYDRRNGYYFQVNAAGSMFDGTLYNCDWDESSWDGVWQGKAHIDDKGWTVEMRIPFSQLRFKRQDKYIWGVNFRRDFARNNERDWVVFVPKNKSGFVSRFPNLVGIDQIVPGRYLEVLPYVTSKAEFTPQTGANPFNDGSSMHGDMGGDLRTGIGSNLTLNATVNPDFGQVDVDPAVVNLTDQETFFPEKRPFFVEGSTIFNFGNQGANDYWGFNWQDPKFFYTRRIGRPPQGTQPDNFDYSDVPTDTRILGALKVTGSAFGGWNVGTLHALTQKESGDFSTAGVRSTIPLEPLTYYGVGRMLRGFHNDHQGIGFMGTLSARQFDEATLPNELSKYSFMGGMDGWTFLDADKTWVISGWSAMTNIGGTATRLQALQSDAEHYLQRPDANYARIDSSATTLTGFGTRLWLNKQSGHIIANSAVGVISPRFDVEDMGYQGFSGVTNAHTGWGYRWTGTGKYKKFSQVLGSAFMSTNFDGDITHLGTWFDTYQQFNNNWDWDKTLALDAEAMSDRQTRGGPVMKVPASMHFSTFAETDSKRTYYYYLNLNADADRAGSWDWTVGPGIEWKPASSLTVRVEPSLYHGINDAQYVGQYVDPLASATYGTRYVFAELEQTTLSANLTLNWSFTPQLSLQMFGQPLIASGKYTHFKELAQPRTYDFLEYGKNGSTFDGTNFIADPDGPGPAPPIDIGNQDFNYLSMRGNAVLRWEYRPGSTLFLVWTQDRSQTEPQGEFDFSHSSTALLQLPARNIFLIKLSYYLGL